MSTLQVNIFPNDVTEYTNLLSANPSIDLTDAPVPASVCSNPTCQLGGPGYYLTSPVPDTGYYEIQFMLDNNYWNCAMQFGNSACGVNIRQAIAHMIDKTIFATKDPNIPVGDGMAIDNPVPTSSGGGLLSANSCLWDSSFLEPNTVGTPCTVGGGSTGNSVGGSSYHLAAATGVASINCPWCQAPGSPDLNAAAQHLVNAGLATGFSTTTSILTNPISTTGLTIPNLFAVANDPIRLDLGQSLADQICYMFTGSYTTNCAYLSYTPGLLSGFNGFTTCTATVCPTWWIFTAGYNGISFYDQSLYNIYNSRFVSGIPAIQPPNGPCSPSSVPTSSAANYMYLCSPAYDGLSNQLETAGCLTATGDPVVGATSNKPTPPGSGLCSNGSLSSHSAAIQAEDIFGQNAFTIPILEKLVQFGYLQCGVGQPSSTICSSTNSWVRAINDASTGLPNYFTWLNIFNPGPVLPGTIRQGFDQVTRSVNPYIASSIHDQYIVGSIYDSLMIQNPLSTTQFFNWMTEFETTPASLGYNPPPHTVLTYRFELRPGLTWQDGRPVTSYDVAFSYLSMVGSGTYLASSASMMTGITVLNSLLFDINVNSTGPFVLPNLTSLPIVPGHYWSNAGGLSWDNAASACGLSCGMAQYTLAGSTVNPCISISGAACTIFPNTLMTVNPSDTAPSFDPILNHIMVGSGPWMCGNVTPSGSGQCTPDGRGNGESTSYTLKANNNYFRSSLNLAKYLWSGESDTNAIGPAAAVGACFNISPPSLPGTCSHWQQGAGNPNTAATGIVVGITAVQIVDIFFNLNWLFPFEWTTNPPTGIAPLPPLLYGTQTFDGSLTYTPNPGGSSCTTLNSYYDC